MLRRAIIFFLLTGFSTSVVLGSEEQTPEQELVGKLYGEQIAAVKATASKEDDEALVKQLLIGAHDQAFSKKLRFTLAMTAMELAGDLGTTAGIDLAVMALNLADSIRPVQPVRKAEQLRDIASARLKRARSDRQNVETLRRLGRTAVRSHLNFVNTVITNPKLTRQAKDSLQLARSLVRRYELGDLSQEVSDTADMLRAMTRQAAKLKLALGRLGATRKSQDPRAIRSASIAVAHVYLTQTGDLIASAKYLAGTGDSREFFVRTAAQFLEAGTLDEGSTLETIEELTKLARGLSEPARTNIARTALEMYRKYLAANPAKTSDAKVNSLIAQLEKMLRKRSSVNIKSPKIR